MLITPEQKLTDEEINFRNQILKHEDNILDQNPHVRADSYGYLKTIASNLRFEGKNLLKSSEILYKMASDPDCSPILTLGGSMLSSGLKPFIVDAVRAGVFKCVVSTGANIFDQDLLEALGYNHYKYDVDEPPKHWKEDRVLNDSDLRNLKMDRIYDTIIDESELRQVDEFMYFIASKLPNKKYTSAEITHEIGAILDHIIEGIKKDVKELQTLNPSENIDVPPLYQAIEGSLIYTCYKMGVPIYIPAMNDCSAAFGWTKLINERIQNNEDYPVFDGMLDFLELTKWKSKQKETGVFVIGGGVPKNYTFDTIVCAETSLDLEVPLHKYTVQVSVADMRDGALSGSTLKEAESWGKVDAVNNSENSCMLWSEATLTIPLIFNDVISRLNVIPYSRVGFFWTDQYLTNKK